MDEKTRQPTYQQSTYQLARTHAFDRYLSALLAPAGQRDALMTWAAVAGEIERIPFVVTDPMIGEIRFQWWLDWLDLVQAGGASGNPLADAMAGIIRSKSLPVDTIRAMIEARIADLYADPVADEAAFVDYLEATEGNAFAIAARISTKHLSDEAESACASAGRAYGTARALAKLPEFVRKGRWPLPLPTPAAGPPKVQAYIIPPEGHTPADILAPEGRELRAESARDAVKIATLALEKARASAAFQEPALRISLLPLALVEPYLAGLEKAGRDPLLEPAGMSPLTRVWRLWRAS